MLNYSFMLVIILLFVTITHSLRVKSFINPLILFAFPIIAQFIIHYYIYEQYMPVSDKTIIVFLGGLFSFFVGYFTFLIFYRSNYTNMYNTKISFGRTNYIFVWLCLIIGLFSMILTQKYMLSLSGTFNIFDSTFLNIREAYIDNVELAPIYVTHGKYFFLFSYVVILYDYLHEEISIHLGIVITLGFFLIYNSILSLARTDFLFTIVPLVMIYINYIQRLQLIRKKAPGGDINEKKKIYFKEKKNKRRLRILFITLSILFLIITSLRTVDGMSLFGPESQIMQYIGRPLSAFDKWLVNYPKSSNDWQIFEPIGKILGILEVDTYDGPAKAVLGQFNVYSYLETPYLQFGEFGVSMSLFLVGFLSNFFYSKYKSGEKYWVIFYSVYSYALIMAFFDWQFGIITYAYLIIFLFLTASMNTVIYKKRKMKINVQSSYKKDC